MDKEYETMFRRLMHEHNELRKYIIDICKLLDIDTSQSVLGANCLEFYAVLSSVTKDKVKNLQEQLKRKEEECKELKQWKKGAGNLFKAQIDNPDKIINRYKQALDEIEKQAKAMNNECFYDDIYDCNNCDMKNSCSYYRKFKILNIINKAKE